MPGAIFLRTKEIEAIKKFYVNKIGMSILIDFKNVIVLKHGNLFLGFLNSKDSIDKCGRIILFYRTRELVDEMYKKLKDSAINKPVEDNKLGTYYFSVKDPEDRVIFFQTFLKGVKEYLLGDELLLTRRSIRYFRDENVPDDVLWKIFEICRFSPTSKNSQSYYFIVIRDRKILGFLASLRGSSSAPIGRAPLAVAICSDPSKSKRYVQDACIAAYHFILTAWFFGLGTCWIAAMDRDDVKEILGVPKDHYIATITPLGYPEYLPSPPPRRLAREMVRFI